MGNRRVSFLERSSQIDGLRLKKDSDQGNFFWNVSSNSVEILQ
jgi:hypothetical protein